MGQSSVYANGTTYKNFKYYKVVASTSPNPKYPEDGYLAVISDKGVSSWSVNPTTDSYNKSPELKSGTKYYFSVTYVFENGKLYGNDVELTVPSYTQSTPPDFSGPSMNATVSGDKINFAWTPVKKSSVTYNGKTYNNFCYYKIVASTEPDPTYPEDGYLTYISDVNAESWNLDPSKDSYNSPTLEPGVKYYFSVTYVFENGKLYANDVQLTVPGNTSQATDFAGPSLNASISGGIINFTWTPVNKSSVTYNGMAYNNFSYYKIVASTSPHPKYPENGYLNYISSATASTWSFNPANDSYNESPKLLSGTKYYFSVTYVFGNGKLYTNDVELVIP